MHQLLVFLHLFGLMLGAAGGFASALIMRRAGSASVDEAKTLRGVGPLLANMSLTGLVIMWATGLILVYAVWGGFGNLPGLFWVKAIFIASLTAAVAAIYMTYAGIRAGNPALAARLPKLGPAAGVSSLLAVLFGVYAFVG